MTVSRAVVTFFSALFPLVAQFNGSTPTGAASPTPLSLSLEDAIARGLKTNVGLLTRENSATNARVDRMRLLTALLPAVTGSAQMTEQQVDLATFGFTGIKAFPIPAVVGPFHYQEAQASTSFSVYDGRAWKAWKSGVESQHAAELSVRDAQDLVVQAVASAYLEIIASAARADATKALVDTAQALYERARDQHRAGTSPAIDELRAQVELKTQQQALLAQTNQVAKDKLALARAIGLPSGQVFDLADTAPYKPIEGMTPADALQRAYAGRADYQSAQAQVRAAELARQSANNEWLPRASINANYGDAGPTFANSHGIFMVTGAVTMDIFEGGKRKADVLAADTTIKQRREDLANLQGQIDQEVRDALLDLSSAADQVTVAQDNANLANQTLTQARDRFAAGVTDNIEVVQAQESVATAQQNLISAVYSHNLAKVNLARAMGATETNLKAFLGGK